MIVRERLFHFMRKIHEITVYSAYDMEFVIYLRPKFSVIVYSKYEVPAPRSILFLFVLG